jgi:hypothetical protein
MIPGLIQIDNFLEDVWSIRDQALELNYVPPATNEGWKGFRCLEQNKLTLEVTALVKSELSKRDSKFANANYDCYFHYTLEETKKEKGYNNNRIHKDRKKDYAGVIYLAPFQVPDSGTSFYDDTFNQIGEVENVFNRFVCYPSNTYHAVQEPFGTSIKDGRLTFTVFIEVKQKQSRTLL